MYSRFREHDYSTKTLDSALSRASALERDSLLERKPPKVKGDRVFYSTRYSTEANGIRNIIKRNWDLVQCDEVLQQVFPDPPIFSFRKAPTIGDRLVHSHTPAKESKSTWLPAAPNGTYRCGHCRQCDIITKGKEFIHPITKQRFINRHYVNCKTTHVIYILSCVLCNAFYVGRTKRRLQDRVAEHRYAVKSGNMDYAMAKHLKEVHSCNSVSFTVLGIHHVPPTLRRGDRERTLNQKESRWIHTLQAMSPPGLNDTIDMISFL